VTTGRSICWASRPKASNPSGCIAYSGHSPTAMRPSGIPSCPHALSASSRPFPAPPSPVSPSRRRVPLQRSPRPRIPGGALSARQPLPPFLTDLPHVARRIIPDQPVLAQAATRPPVGPSTCGGPSLPAWREAERTEVNSEVPHAVVAPCTADPAYRPDHLKLNVSRADLLAELPRALSQAGTFGLQSQKASRVSGRTPIPPAVVRYDPRGRVLAETE
jgi:hypothetical protein